MLGKDTWRTVVTVVTVVTLFALGGTGAATAREDAVRGIDPNQGESLVEVTLPNKAQRSGCSSRPTRTASISTSTTSGKTATGR